MGRKQQIQSIKKERTTTNKMQLYKGKLGNPYTKVESLYTQLFYEWKEVTNSERRFVHSPIAAAAFVPCISNVIQFLVKMHNCFVLGYPRVFVHYTLYTKENNNINQFITCLLSFSILWNLMCKGNISYIAISIELQITDMSSVRRMIVSGMRLYSITSIFLNHYRST